MPWSQPFLVPVRRRCSRSASSRLARGSSVTARGAPLTCSVTVTAAGLATSGGSATDMAGRYGRSCSRSIALCDQGIAQSYRSSCRGWTSRRCMSGAARSGRGTTRRRSSRRSPRWTSRSPRRSPRRCTRRSTATTSATRRRTPPALREAFAGFAARRLGWSVDPEQVTLVPDVMAGLIELCRVLLAGPVAFATPAYPPFFGELPQAASRVELPLTPTVRRPRSARAALAAGTRARVANPHNPTGRVAARAELDAIAERCADAGVWVLADEIHAPLTLAGASHTPWLEVSTPPASAASRSRRRRRRSTSPGSRPRWSSPPPSARRAARRPAAAARRPGGAARRDRRRGRLPRRRRVARRGARPARRATARCSASCSSGAPAIRWTPPEADLPRVARLPRARARRRPGRRLPRPRARRAQPRARLRPEGAGHVRLNFGTSPELLARDASRGWPVAVRARLRSSLVTGTLCVLAALLSRLRRRPTRARRASADADATRPRRAHEHAGPAVRAPAFRRLERRFDARLGVYAVDTGNGREVALPRQRAVPVRVHVQGAGGGGDAARATGSTGWTRRCRSRA